MSSFIVDAEHIHVLVEAATGPMTYGLGPLLLDKPGFYSLTPDQDMRTKIGQMLLDENVAAVNMTREDEVLLAYTYQPPLCRWSPLEILKAVDCFVYQACESLEWDESIAKEFCNKLRALCIQSLPGYDEAPWYIDRETVPHRVS
ncbi:MAG: hypothetical protein QM705_11140 [Ancrocorticia sp.]